MNIEALFLFLILLLGLVLCSFLGGDYKREGMTGNFTVNFKGDVKPPSQSGASNGSEIKYDNYNHFIGSSTQLANGTIFYGQEGTTAVVIPNSNGSQSLQITLLGSSNPVTFTPFTPQGNEYYAPNGETASIITDKDGKKSIMLKPLSGTPYYYYNVSGLPSTTNTSTQYYGSTGDQIQKTQYTLAYQDNSGNTLNINNNDYIDSLPKGIPKSQIPSGKEDLYILKTQIVPPVCPACPNIYNCRTSSPNLKNSNSSSNSSSNLGNFSYSNNYALPSTPFSETTFHPNYNSTNREYLPVPVLNDFSTFGM